MIFDLASMNCGTRYLYDTGTFYTSFTKHSYTYGTNFTVTNSGGYLELYYPDINDWYDYHTPRINLTGFSKVYLEVPYTTSGINAKFYIGSNYYIYSMSDAEPIKSLPISKTDSTVIYEIDITDLVGEYYLGIANFPSSSQPFETIRISRFYLQ